MNNLKNGETYLTAFNRLYESGEFKGQLKAQGAVDKQTKFLDEFLVYPPYEKITEMSLEEQDIFIKKELQAIQNYFPYLFYLPIYMVIRLFAQKDYCGKSDEWNLYQGKIPCSQKEERRFQVVWKPLEGFGICFDRLMKRPLLVTFTIPIRNKRTLIL